MEGPVLSAARQRDVTGEERRYFSIIETETSPRPSSNDLKQDPLALERVFERPSDDLNHHFGNVLNISYGAAK